MATSLFGAWLLDPFIASGTANNVVAKSGRRRYKSRRKELPCALIDGGAAMRHQTRELVDFTVP
jgi:hypothetical protein